MKRVLYSGLAATLLTSVALAVALDTITLKRVATVGHKTNFKVEGSMTLSFDGQEHTLAAKAIDTVTAVDSNGNITVESVQKDLLFDGNPPPGQAGDPPAVKAVYKPNGEIVSVTAPQGPGGSSIRLQNLSAFYYPEKPVNVGDMWSVDIKSAVEGAVPLHADFKLVGPEKVGTTDTYKVDETAKETGTDAGSIHNVFWVNPTDGEIVKQTSELTNVAFGPIVATAGKMTMTKIGD